MKCRWIAVLLSALSGTGLRAQSVWDSLRVAAVAAGGTHTCALTMDARTLCWGGNADGELGVPPDSSGRQPVTVATPGLRSLTAGAHHTCGLDKAGTAWCWGSNRFGQLGDRRKHGSHIPMAVRSPVRFTAITAGYDHTCALGVDSLAYCWGDQWDRAVGSFDAGDNVRDPIPVRDGHRFINLSAGGHHTCGVSVAHRVYCWGDNSAGQLGPRGGRQTSYSPTEVDSPGLVDSIGAGDAYSCAIKSDSLITCWGKPPFGWAAVSRSPARALSTGSAMVCAIHLNGAADCGTNDSGHRPVDVGNASGEQYIQIASGSRHSCAITLTHRLLCWGDDSVGQLGRPAK